MRSRSKDLVLHKGAATAAGEKLGSRGQAWFCTTGLPSDIIVEVDGMSFHLHKFPLMAKSGRLQRLITEAEEHPNKAARRGQSKGDDEEEPQEEGEGGGEIKEEEEEEEEVGEEEAYQHISLADFPGNCEAFETAAKFCYGVKIDLNAWNVAPLRCVAEYLEMTEEVCEENLVARTERFLAQSVLPSIKQSIKTLKSCEDVLPFADDLGIAQRCVDAIAAGASVSDPASLFGWPINEGRRRGGGGSSSSEQILWNGIETGLLRRRSGVRSSSFAAAASAGSWLEDLAILSLPMYKRVIAALKSRDLSSVAIEGSLISYAQQSIPGLFRSRRKHSSAPVASEPEQRELLETVIANLPPEKSSAAPAASAAATTKFLFGLLRTAHILHASEAARAALERKIASQLERATLDDLLIPSYSYLSETLYDVDCVERILAHYLDDLEAERAALATAEAEAEGGVEVERRLAAPLKLVGKLVDGYLAEIASDANLKVDKFYGLAVALPDDARVYHDGLYRAVDIYLKAHPRMREEEKERVCGVLDCRKLTLEACTHAAQNERLPLRAVVQVLFFEQLQLRRVIAGTLLAAEGEAAVPAAAGGEGGRAWRSAMRENQVLRLDMDSMRNRVQELERECSSMKKALSKLDAGGEGSGAAEGEEDGGRRRRRRYGCRFSTQVCDSHERNVVESRRPGRELSS
ncbi:hypothetical protein C4D60_Mb08t04320 [Musa balbisiana]|uniref:NPH3 domain-containing protein n=1 Tax=Musa balbisiana TaxID=52838 RepID=A0A4S8K1C0_MUSBA|nr:hypothetical protein C4D60_Mb08t04320 [Musa balbisiana]